MLSHIFAVYVVATLPYLTPPDQTGERDVPVPVAAEPTNDAQVLSGPKVKTAKTARSLVERGFGGKLKRLEVDPGQAALALIELSAQEKAAADAVLFERAAIMDKLVTDNLREVVEIANAFQAQDHAQGLRLLKGLMDNATAWRARHKLEDELAEKLTETNATELRRLTSEHIGAVVEESANEPGTNGKPRGRLAAVAIDRLTMLGHEIRQSYGRTVGAGAKDLDALLKRLAVTPEQESTIRVAIQDAYLATYGKPTKAQQTAAFLKIYNALDTEQRRDFAKYMGEQRGVRQEDESTEDTEDSTSTQKTPM